MILVRLLGAAAGSSPRASRLTVAALAVALLLLALDGDLRPVGEWSL